MKLPIVELSGYRADLENDVLVVTGETAKGTKVTIEVAGNTIGPLVLILLKGAQEFPGQGPAVGTLVQPISLDDVRPVQLEDGRPGLGMILEGGASVVMAPSDHALTTLKRCLGLVEPPPRLN